MADNRLPAWPAKGRSLSAAHLLAVRLCGGLEASTIFKPVGSTGKARRRELGPGIGPGLSRLPCKPSDPHLPLAAPPLSILWL